MEDFISIYIEDMKEFIAILYDSLLILEKNHDDNDAVNEIFRAFHTMKSSTAAMDFKETSHFIHCMEDLLQEIRDGRIKVTEEVVGLLFKSHDLLDGFIHHLVQHGTEGEFGGSQLLAEVNNTIRARSEEIKRMKTTH